MILTSFERELLHLIVAPAGDYPCRLDHHGVCQEHSWDSPCIVACAVAALFSEGVS